MARRRSPRLYPPCAVRAVVRAQVAFQAAYDYVDTLAEQHSPDPVRNGDRLHRALLGRARSRARTDRLLRAPRPLRRRRLSGDASSIPAASRCATLPSFASVAAPARRAAARIVSYQSLNLGESQGGHTALERWARGRKPRDSDLQWWEMAASAGSSLGVFVLIAAAAEQVVCAEEAVAIESAYFPWIGSLHTLLDSLVDRREDAASGQRSLLDYYSSPQEAATCMARLAVESLHRTTVLPRGRQHALVLAGMASHYLSSREASLPDALLATRTRADGDRGARGSRDARDGRSPSGRLERLRPRLDITAAR